MQVTKERYGIYHECFHLNCDPDIIKSTEIFLKACIAEFSMSEYYGCECTSVKRISFPNNRKHFNEWICDNGLGRN